MTETLRLSSILASINSFEEFEDLKLKADHIQAIAQAIIEHHQLPKAPLKLFSEGTNIVFSHGNDTVIKIFPPFHSDQFKSDLLVLKHLQDKLSIKTPTVKYDGEIFGWPYLVMTQLEGTLLETLWDEMNHGQKMIIIHELGALTREVHSLPTQGLEQIDCHWEQFICRQLEQCVEQHRSCNLAHSLLGEIPAYLASTTDTLITIEKPVLLTGEYTPMNFLVKQVEGTWHIHGLIDFGDSMLGLPEYDLLGPGAFLIQGDKFLLEAFLRAYGHTADTMTPALSHQLMALMLLHKYSNLNVQVRIKDWKSRVKNLKDLEDLVWGF
jgi:hygromycin-B 7''-O-kinase